MAEEIIIVNDGAAITVTKARTISETSGVSEQVERLKSKYRILSEDPITIIGEALDRITEKTRILEQITAIAEELRAYKNDIELVPPAPQAPPETGGNIIGFRRTTVSVPRPPKERREIREVWTPEQRVYCPIVIPAFTEQIIIAHSPIAIVITEWLQQSISRISLSTQASRLASPIAIQTHIQRAASSRLQLNPIQQKSKARIQLLSEPIQQIGKSDILSAEILRYTKLVKLYLLANGIESPQRSKTIKSLAKQQQFVKLARLFFMAEQIE